MNLSKIASNIDELQSYFEKNKASIQASYTEFLRFKSISADPLALPELRKCASWLSEKIVDMGGQVQLWDKPHHAPIVFGQFAATSPDAPTLLIYNHYDVQPTDPIEEWASDPFEPRIEHDTIYARGASDNKGQCFFVLLAIKAFMENGKPPCNIKLLIEGEEESSSTLLQDILLEKKDDVQADYVMVIDVGMREPTKPAITLGVRGITALSVHVKGPARDLHSGVYGGIACNPLHALVSLLASLRTADGAIAVPHFYDEVVMPSSLELASISSTFDEQRVEHELGQPLTGGEQAYPPLIRNWFRPTLEINGIHGGYGGHGYKTVIPKEAVAKLTCRLVPNQDPLTIAAHIQEFLLSKAPKGVTVKVDIHGGHGKAFRISKDSSGIRALEQAMKVAFRTTPEYILDGASIPIIPLLQEACGGQLLAWGVGLTTDHIHSPNEHFDFRRMEQGFLTLCTAISLLAEEKSSIIVE